MRTSAVLASAVTMASPAVVYPQSASAPEDASDIDRQTLNDCSSTVAENIILTGNLAALIVNRVRQDLGLHPDIPVGYMVEYLDLEQCFRDSRGAVRFRAFDAAQIQLDDRELDCIARTVPISLSCRTYLDAYFEKITGQIYEGEIDACLRRLTATQRAKTRLENLLRAVIQYRSAQERQAAEDARRAAEDARVRALKFRALKKGSTR